MPSSFDLRDVFTSAEKPRSAFLIGTEVEKFGVVRRGEQLVPLHYDAHNDEAHKNIPGIRDVLTEFQALGWQPHAEYEGGPTLMLTRDGGSITLEPGSQLELSGAPLATLDETYDELLVHRKELKAIGEKLGIHWLALGFHPTARLADLSFVPKLRYGVMREYLPTQGSRGLDMMQRTSTVQANLDFSSESDAMKKLALSLRVQPIVTALFAHSPFYEGKARGNLSERADVWLHMAPSRCGLLPSLWGRPLESLRYEDYIQWALAAPMFLIKRGKKVLPNTGQSFADYLAIGFGGEQANEEDWQTHVNSLFPESRLKRTLEMRGADAQNAEGCVALGALWKGLLYNDESLEQIAALTHAWTHDEVANARLVVPTQGMKTPLQGTNFLAHARTLLRIATAGLQTTDRKYLAPIEAALAAEKSLGQMLLAPTDAHPDLLVQKLSF